MILTISNHNHRPTLLALRTEAADCRIDRLSDSRTLNRNRLGRDRVQEHLSRHIVCSDRQLNKGIARKDNKSDTVLTKLVHESRDSKLRTLQPVWRIILRKHRVRDIKHDHNLGTLSLMLLKLGTDLRT